MITHESTPVSPLIERQQLLVAVTHDIDLEFQLAHEYGVGIEIQTFSFPEILASIFEPLAEQVERLLSNAEDIPIGFHGAFIDTTHYSQDPEIRKVSRARYIQSMDLAQRFGASYVLFHSQYNPVIKVTGYADQYHTGSVQFWHDMVQEAHKRSLCIYLENMFDDSPQPLRRLVSELGTPEIRICLDIAHAAVFSEKPLKHWLDALGPYIQHIHMNDCNGETDQHLGLGQGVIDFQEAFRLLAALPQTLRCTIETSGMNSPASFAYLGLDKIE